MYRENYSLDPVEFTKINMTDLEFRKLSRFINTGYGIKLPDNKKIMVQARLQKRLRELNLNSYSAYFDLVFSDKAKFGEMINMIDIITTNKTDFFRESAHFDYLKRVVLPEFVKNHRSGNSMRIWSAGCSSGEEPYTIAMCLSEFSKIITELDFRILGTDLSTRILRAAENAVYTNQQIADIPAQLKNKYLLKSKGPKEGRVKIVPEIKSKVYFKRLNFMDNYYPVQGMFDVVFCRNVLIYFERNVQEQVINKICNFIPAGGFLFLGHSESILGMKVPLAQIRPTIYRKI